MARAAIAVLFAVLVPRPVSSTDNEDEEFDCHEGYVHWKTNWTEEKKTWCCENMRFGCDFDCRVGLEQRNESWSPLKQGWCCLHKGLGCPSFTEGTSTTTPFYFVRHTTTAAPRTTGTSRSPSSTSVQASTSTDEVNFLAGLTHHVRDRVEAMDESAPETHEDYDCDAGFRNCIAGWSDVKKSWCTLHKGVHCEAYDCSVGLDTCMDTWSMLKKAWCLHDMGVICQETAVVDSNADSRTESECFEENTAWEPMDMHGTVATKVADVRACQELCANTTDCRHFSFWKLGRHCHIQDAFAVRATARLGFVSGPFACWNQVDHQKYIRERTGAILPKEFNCIERGSLYSPILGLPTYFRQFSRTEEGTLKAVEACRQRCVDTERCGHWSLSRHGHMCRLARHNANRLSADYYTLSGHETCEASDVISRSAVNGQHGYIGSRLMGNPAAGLLAVLLALVTVAVALLAGRRSLRRGTSQCRMMLPRSATVAPGPAYMAVNASQGAD